MSSRLDNAFPGGDESDYSDEEWDISVLPKSKTRGLVPVAEDDFSRLKRAIADGNVQAVEELLESGMDVETRVGLEWTPLMCSLHAANFDLTKLLLDRGANSNFSKNGYTVLMAACTASASEDKIAPCMELLLSRNADPNLRNSSGMTCLMLVARDGYTKLSNLLASHEADLNAQDNNGFTALAIAVVHGQNEAVLKLLQLGADKSIKNYDGHSPYEVAKLYKQPEIARILSCAHQTSVSCSSEETLSKLIKGNSEDSAESTTKLGDIELLLHGLNLEYLADIMNDNDITWSHLLTMEKDDLQKLGITDPEDQQKVLNAVRDMQLDSVDMDTLNQLQNIDRGNEELYNFLISLKQQCCYLTETVQDILNRFPRQSSELILSLDPQKEAQAICNDLVGQIGDLQKEVVCLRNLMRQMDQDGGSYRLPQAGFPGNWRRRRAGLLASGTIVSALCAAGVLFLLSRAAKGNDTVL